MNRGRCLANGLLLRELSIGLPPGVGIAKKARILPLLAWFWNAQFEQIAQKIAKYSLWQNFEWIHCLQTKIGANFGNRWWAPPGSRGAALVGGEVITDGVAARVKDLKADANLLFDGHIFLARHFAA